MKKLITIVCCFALFIVVLTGCGNTDVDKATDTTTKTTTMVTEPTTASTMPSTDATHPSTIPDSGFMPNNDGNDANAENGSGNTTDDRTMHPRTHAPSIVAKNR